MFMSVRTEDGEAEILKIDGPGSTFCFCVGTLNGPRSSIWVVQSPENKRDVYITNLSIADFQKVSLHASNRWRFAWTSEYAPQVVPTGEDRLIERWERPDEVVPGWTDAFHIWVPHDDLTVVEGLPTPKSQYFKDVCTSEEDIRWIPAPGPGAAIGFHVVIGRADQVEVKFDGY